MMRLRCHQSSLLPLFDVAPLRNIIESLLRRVDSIQQKNERLHTENAALLKQIEECTHREEVSERQFTALFGAVTAMDKKVVDIMNRSMLREEVNSKFLEVTDELAKTRQQCNDLDLRKIDTQSTVLETRVREVAEDCCFRFLSRREQQQKDWVELQVAGLDNRVSNKLEQTQAKTSQTLGEAIGNMNRSVAETHERLAKLQQDVESAAQATFSVDKSLAHKLVSHETVMDAMDERVCHELDSLWLGLKNLVASFGVSYTVLTDLWDPTIQCEDKGDIAVSFDRAVAREERHGEFLTGWKAVRAASSRLTQALPQSCLDEREMTERRQGIEVTRVEKLAALEQRLAAETTRTAVLPSAAHQSIPATTKTILGSSLISELRRSLLEQVGTKLGAVKDELVTDFSSQIHAQQKELKTKLGSQRAVELISEHTTKQVKAETLVIVSDVEQLRQEAVSRDELATHLSTKADHVELARLVSKEDLTNTENVLRTAIAETTSDVSARIISQVEGKLKDLSEKKVDREDPNIAKLVHAMEEGWLAPHGAGWTNAEHCISCNRAVSAADLPPQAVRTTPEQLQAAREAQLQAAQEAVFAKQHERPEESAAKRQQFSLKKLGRCD